MERNGERRAEVGGGCVAVRTGGGCVSVRAWRGDVEAMREKDDEFAVEGAVGIGTRTRR